MRFAIDACRFTSDNASVDIALEVVSTFDYGIQKPFPAMVENVTVKLLIRAEFMLPDDTF